MLDRGGCGVIEADDDGVGDGEVFVVVRAREVP